MNSDQAAAKMLNDPDFFFKNYPLKMWGGTGAYNADALNLRNYEVGRRAAAVVGGKTGHLGATRPGTTLSFITKNISSFGIAPQGHPVFVESSLPFQTCSVPMVNLNSNLYGCLNLLGNVAAMHPYWVTAAANYMTTGQLSGCCFTWREVGGNLHCIHIQPSGNLAGAGGDITGAALQNYVALHGRFHGSAASLNTFGRNDYGEGTTAIVAGIFYHGAWRLYAQASTTGFDTISSAWRLHPGAVVQLR